MQNGQEKKHLGWLWTVGALFLWLFSRIALNQTGFGTVGILRTVLSTVAVGIICWRIAASEKAENQRLSKGFDFYEAYYPYFTVGDISKVLIADALKERCRNGRMPVAKNVLRKRILFTAGYLVVNFLLMLVLCTKGGAIFVGSVLTVVYGFLFFKTNTMTELVAAAKAAPDTPITQVVAENTVDAEELPNGKLIVVAGILVFALSIGGVLGLNWKDRLRVKPVDGASEAYCQVSSFKPGLTGSSIVKIPETVDGKTVVRIGDRAFKNCRQLWSVQIPDTVTVIGKEAFDGCKNLYRVKLSENLKTIDSFAFRDCKNLSEITLPQSLEVLNGESFYNCASLKSIAIPEKVTEIRGNTFEGCVRLSEVTLHEGIIDIHAYAFKDCKSLKEIALPPEITEIHAYTFENCASLEMIEIPMGVTRIAAHAFYGCSRLNYVFVPDTVTEIGSSAFRQCGSLKEIQLPDGVSVNEKAFEESPTQIQKKVLSDEILKQIWDEIEAKEPAETMYIAYYTDQPDLILQYAERTVLLADSQRLKDIMPEGQDVRPADAAQVLEYLQQAKNAGFKKIVYGVYSEIGTREVGYTYLSAQMLSIDEGIAQMEARLAEAADE